MPLSFEAATGLVSSLQNRGWRLGLDRMHEVCSRLGLADFIAAPSRYVHVAGTNGKGSVTAFVQSILVEQGWKTGACYSPFVFDVRERIQFSVGAQGASPLVSREDFASLVEEAWPVAESLDKTELGGPTEFEFKTGMGFLHWAHNDADYVALEVGLGGRLDATNVVSAPACSVITSIGLDHVEILGNTLAEIAIEKAGIIKPGRPVVVGDVAPEALHAIETIAKVNGSPLWRYGHEFVLSTGLDGYRVSTPGGNYERLNPGIKGAAQPHNMAVAIAACDAAGAVRDAKRVGRGVGKAFAPGRMQYTAFQGRRMLLDGAHNAEAAQNLVRDLQSVGKVVLLSGMLEGHSPGSFYEPLATVIEEVHFAPIQFHRARAPKDLDQESGFLFRRSHAHASVKEALEACLAVNADLILVTGSFYLVGEVGRMIGLG